MNSLNFPRLKYLSALPLLFALACNGNVAAPSATPLPTAAAATATSAPATLAATTAPTNTPHPFILTSPAFKNDETIPNQYACTGPNVSPELNWGDPPAGTQSLALIFHDPTLGGNGWTHWVIFNLPPDLRQIAEKNDPAHLPAQVVQGTTSFGTTGYRGPCPPTGSTHNYVFTLYALDTKLTLGKDTDRKTLLAAMQGHILATAELKGQFTR